MLKSVIKNKKGQESMSIPFGFIFALILIVVFIFAAIYGIKFFLGISKCSQVGYFYEDLQNKVNSAFEAQTYNDLFEITVPGATKVCFGNLTAPITNPLGYQDIDIYQFEDANTFIVPSSSACNMPFKKIARLNISEITKQQNPFCVNVGSKITIKRDFYDRNVLIK
jgi:hypothetical protein